MRTSDGQKMQVPGQGCGRVSTATGVTPESVRTGRMRRRAASSGSEPAAPNARSPARISLFEKSGLRMALDDAVERARVERVRARDLVEDGRELRTVRVRVEGRA